MAQDRRENMKQAMDTLRAYKMRSALTMCGVVLGVSVIMLVAALMTGFDHQIQENIKQYGADTAFISRWDQGPHGDRRPLDERRSKQLTLEDGDALKEKGVTMENGAESSSYWEDHNTGPRQAGGSTASHVNGG